VEDFESLGDFGGEVECISFFPSSRIYISTLNGNQMFSLVQPICTV